MLRGRCLLKPDGRENPGFGFSQENFSLMSCYAFAPENV
jgi:hypothetical protein